jgi:hypothetical protein
MARKPKAKHPAAPQSSYAEWRKRAAALLERQGISPVTRERDWRNLFISGATPERAPELAAVEARNVRPPFGRKRGT